VTAGWADSVIWWHVYPLAFTGAPFPHPAFAEVGARGVDGGAVPHRRDRHLTDEQLVLRSGWAVFSA
jgi:hypothetical protein